MDRNRWWKRVSDAGYSITDSLASEEEVEVPGKRLSMRKIREVLRLYYDLKLGQRQIARSVRISQSTVHDYLTRFTASGLNWPLPAALAEAELEERLFHPESDRLQKSGLRPKDAIVVEASRPKNI